VDNEANLQHNGQDCDISEATSRSRILVIHAEKEHEIARQILNFPGDNARP